MLLRGLECDGGSAAAAPAQLDGGLLMRNLLIHFIVIVSVSGCVGSRDEPQPIEKTADPYAGLPGFLASNAGHQAMMKMIHRRPKNGNLGSIGS